MDFLLLALLLLLALAGGSFLLVEGSYLFGRACSWLSYRLRWRFRSWRFARYRNASMRRCKLTRGKPVSFGSLRVTRSRKEQFDGPPDIHGQE